MPLRDQKAVLCTFLLLCDVEFVFRTETFAVTKTSLLQNCVFPTQEYLFGKKSPILAHRLLDSIQTRYPGELDFWKFIDFFSQSLQKEKREDCDLVAFELFDADKNGYIGVVDVFELIQSRETRALPEIHSDLKRVKRELQELAINGQKDELETAINFRRFQQLVPKPTALDVVRAALRGNYLKRKELIRRFNPCGVIGN